MILRLWASARSSANYAFVPLPQFTDILYGLILCCQSKYFYCSLKKILFGVVSRRSNCKANPMTELCAVKVKFLQLQLLCT